MVSVVIPTCNRRMILSQCLAALADQTFADFEVIVVDDCSTDNTIEMLESLLRDRPSLRLRWFRHERHAGANAARNRGIQEARGEIVAFLDSDCIAEADWLEKLVAGFDADDVAAVTGLVTEPPPGNVYELALAGTCRVHGRGDAPRLVGGNMAVRRALLAGHGFDEDAQWRSQLRGEKVDSPVCDEESLFLMFRAQGRRMRVVPNAKVMHVHGYDRRSFFRHALAGGKAAAFLVHKYHLPPRLDVLPLLLAYLTVPLALTTGLARWTPLVFVAAAIAAIGFNELTRKGKTTLQAFYLLPLMLLYYHVRVFAYFRESVLLLLGVKRVDRVRLRGMS